MPSIPKPYGSSSSEIERRSQSSHRRNDSVRTSYLRHRSSGSSGNSSNNSSLPSALDSRRSSQRNRLRSYRAGGTYSDGIRTGFLVEPEETSHNINNTQTTPNSLGLTVASSRNRPSLLSMQLNNLSTIELVISGLDSISSAYAPEVSDTLRNARNTRSNILSQRSYHQMRPANNVTSDSSRRSLPFYSSAFNTEPSPPLSPRTVPDEGRTLTYHGLNPSSALRGYQNMVNIEEPHPLWNTSSRISMMQRPQFGQEGGTDYLIESSNLWEGAIDGLGDRNRDHEDLITSSENEGTVTTATASIRASEGNNDEDDHNGSRPRRGTRVMIADSPEFDIIPDIPPTTRGDTDEPRSYVLREGDSENRAGRLAGLTSRLGEENNENMAVGVSDNLIPIRRICGGPTYLQHWHTRTGTISVWQQQLLSEDAV